MSFREDRRRRRGRARVWGTLLAIGAVSALLAFTFYLGGEFAAGQINALDSRIAELTETNDRLLRTKGEAEAGVGQLRTAYQQLEQRYAREVPKGPAQEIQRQVQIKLEEGIAPQRITAVVAMLEAKRSCEPPENKRFYVKVPLYRGGGTEAGFGGGLLRVSGQGEAALNPRNNQPQSFFEGDKPVQVVLIAGDSERQVQGSLPLDQTIIGAGAEWRVRMARGARGFINVTVDRCKFP
ncbi:hypothetical protein [Allostella humosa]|uniref:hypothetical protein n=1 Tax=Stella humosa TaxID=94 RepID=UPI001154D6A9|nr:hypothetical protein [Stella humosa]